MSMYSRKITTGLLLVSALFSVQVRAEIQTLVVGTTAKPLSGISKFENLTSETPCFVHWAGNYPEAFASVVSILKSEGFNITNEGDPTCMIEITGYVTVPDKSTGSIPITLVDVLINKEKFKPIGPALKSTSIIGATSNTSGMIGDQIGANGLNDLSQVGGMINGFHGSVAGTALGALVNIFSGTQSRQKTPPGIVYINGLIMFGHFLPKFPIVTGVYAASNTPEMPQNLINAAVKKFAQMIWEEKNKYNKANGLALYTPVLPLKQIGVETPLTNTMSTNAVVSAPGTAQNSTAPTNEAVPNSPVGSIDKDAQKAITSTAQTADNGNAQK